MVLEAQSDLRTKTGMDKALALMTFEVTKTLLRCKSDTLCEGQGAEVGGEQQRSLLQRDWARVGSGTDYVIVLTSMLTEPAIDVIELHPLDV